MIGVAQVAAGGLVGAPARYLLDQWLSARIPGLFPWGTFAVNASGAFVLGVVSGLVLFQGMGPVPADLVGTGFCGAYTTFSTFSYETIRLFEDGDMAAAVGNLAGSLLTGLLAAGLGLWIASVV